MKSVFCLLFLLASLVPVWAGEEELGAAVAEAVEAIEGEGREVYLVVGIGSSIEEPNAEFSSGLADGIIPVHNETFITDVGAYLGRELVELAEGRGLNLEGGVKASFFGLGRPSFSRFDYELPVGAEPDRGDGGNIFMVGPEGSLLYTHKGPDMGFYGGFSGSLARYGVEYNGGSLANVMDISGWTPVGSIKVGAVMDDIIRLGAEYSWTGDMGPIGSVRRYKVEAAFIFSR